MREAVLAARQQWATADDLRSHDSGILRAWLAQEGVRHPGMDGKACAAALVGTVSAGFATELAMRHLAASDMSGLRLDRLRMKLVPFQWEHDGRSGVANRLQVRWEPDRDICHEEPDGGDPSARAAVHALVVAFFTPLIRRLVTLTALPAAALWRNVADALAYGYLEAGRERGDMQAAMAEARALIAVHPSPLFNRQTGFIAIARAEIGIGDADEASHWFIDRGGCCRSYTCAGESHCLTCCLLPQEKRRAGLIDYLKRSAVLETAA